MRPVWRWHLSWSARASVFSVEGSYRRERLTEPLQPQTLLNHGAELILDAFCSEANELMPELYLITTHHVQVAKCCRTNGTALVPDKFATFILISD